MIFGGVRLSGIFERNDKIKEIENFSSWPGAIKFPLNYFDLKGGFLLNPELPFKPSDFFYINEVEKILVLFSGKIYNRNELIRQVNNTEISDPQLIFQLFINLGPPFVEKLNGDFAICIYLPFQKEIFLFRDQIGIQPLVFSDQKDYLFFSSDNLSLCRAFQGPDPINMDPVLSNIKAVNHLLTYNPKVKKIIPGHYVHFSQLGIITKKYWHPEKIKINNRLNYEEVLARIEALLEKAVSIRCDKRFNAGTHLSGGLDSSIVAAYARKNYHEQNLFWGFSWSPDNPTSERFKFDERSLVKHAALLNNIIPVFSTIEKNDFLKFIKDYYHNYGYFSEYKTIENAKKNNINLLFSGWGGDEFISKGNSGIDSDLLFNLKLKLFFSRNPIKKPRKLAQTLLYFIFLPALGVLDPQMKKIFSVESSFLKEEHNKQYLPTLRKYFFYRSRKERHLNFIYNYHLSERTERWFIMGYQKGIVYRYPLLDKDLIELILQIPSHLMCRNSLTRIILRDLGKNFLPESILKNEDKRDPVYIHNRFNYFDETSRELFDELLYWERNPDLYFIDFNMLRKDIEIYKQNPKAKDFRNLQGKLIFFKALHEFTKTYRSLPEGFERDGSGEVHKLNTDTADAGE